MGDDDAAGSAVAVDVGTGSAPVHGDIPLPSCTVSGDRGDAHAAHGTDVPGMVTSLRWVRIPASNETVP